ncbi:MAG TPA: hypothetical protein PLX89_14905 [Verrucomicrobiota bacterium]|nr:hypothetical protein [Verrucomicrobiales bacterium]HRI14280.1 hypothetical protein [Verrucomicrobiota bacterium]
MVYSLLLPAQNGDETNHRNERNLNEVTMGAVAYQSLPAQTGLLQESASGEIAGIDSLPYSWNR